ncbi:MAG: type II and III secretion system protein family protein [Pseudomonadota bacterium]
MHMKQILSAGLIGLAVSTFIPVTSFAQNLEITSGTTSRNLSVSINRAVVVESDTPFAELSVANPGIADIATLSDRTIYVLGKAPGRTTMTLLGPDGRLITNVEIRVAPDIAEFKERLQEILPGEKINVRTANDGIVLSGVVSSVLKLDRALDLAERYAPEAVTNMMSVGGEQQVMLKVRFAEMSRSVSKDLSVSLGFSGTSGNFQGLGGSGSGAPNAFSGSPNLVTNSGQSEGALAIGFGSGSLQAAVLIEALETKGLVRTLAEPNLTALSGQQAEFLAGGEVPIPIVGDDGVGIEYRAFGVELAFTPTVVDGDVINLNLATSVSSLDTTNSVTLAATQIPAFSTRRSSTTVELRDGESFAIAGLLQDDFTDLAGQVPWLGDVPVLGALFRSANYNRRQTELVVIVTAHLVSPVRGDAFVLPTDRVGIPTEADLFLNGNIARSVRNAPTPSGEVARQDFSGSYGYVLE